MSSSTPIYILGISAYYHDSAAALLQDGNIMAAAQEERFTRKKHDPGFPTNAVTWCLEQANISIADLEAIVFYDKPLLKFERLLETYLSYAPRGLRSFTAAMPVWLKEKLFLKTEIRDSLKAISGNDELPSLYFSEHHLSHAASAFYPSPFENAAVLCLDGVGEWATTTAWHGTDKQLSALWEIDFPHSLGLLYSAFTYYCGFKVNSGEYKLMGLAPYGTPKYVDIIREHLIQIADDGSYHLDMKYFDYATGLRMTNRHFHELFSAPPREPESEISQKEMDLAASIQVVLEDVVIKLAQKLRNETGCENLCLSGGVALNCVANGKLHKTGIFNNIWIQPAAGDAGGAIGCAMSYWHQYLDKTRHVSKPDAMRAAQLGPAYPDIDIAGWIEAQQYPALCLDEDDLFEYVAGLLDKGNVIGWFQGPMEFGPRALGNRSILGDPRNRDMQTQMNLKIKYRESFRPFAPAILADKVSDWFDLDIESPYMLMVANVNESQLLPVEDQGKTGLDKLREIRSLVPAITHVDNSARIQTVTSESNTRFHKLITAFDKLTGCPILVNTSFNVRGEPIVMTPEDAYRCFMRTEMDFLVLGNNVLEKTSQPEWQDNTEWETEYALD